MTELELQCIAERAATSQHGITRSQALALVTEIRRLRTLDVDDITATACAAADAWKKAGGRFHHRVSSTIQDGLGRPELRDAFDKLHKVTVNHPARRVLW